MSDSGEIDPWEQARRFKKCVGDMSATFTTCVRTLLANDAENAKTGKDGVSAVCRDTIDKKLLRSPTLVSHLYYATKTFHSDALAQRGEIAPTQFVEVMGLKELAALLTITYVHRRLVSRFPEDDAANFTAVIQQYVDLAVPLGQAIPTIGSVRALLVGATRYLAWGTFAVKDPKGYKKYKVGIKVKKIPFDLEEELANWGTHHVYVGSTILQGFGFGIETSSAYFNGLSATDTTNLSPDELRYKVAQIWLDALVLQGSTPTDTLGDDFMLSDDKTDAFVDRVQQYADNGSQFSWLSKRRSDIGPQKTPDLKFDYTRLDRLKKKGKGQEEDSLESDEEGQDTRA